MISTRAADFNRQMQQALLSRCLRRSSCWELGVRLAHETSPWRLLRTEGASPGATISKALSHTAQAPSNTLQALTQFRRTSNASSSLCRRPEATGREEARRGFRPWWHWNTPEIEGLRLPRAPTVRAATTEPRTAMTCLRKSRGRYSSETHRGRRENCHGKGGP